MFIACIAITYPCRLGASSKSENTFKYLPTKKWNTKFELEKSRALQSDILMHFRAYNQKQKVWWNNAGICIALHPLDK